MSRYSRQSIHIHRRRKSNIWYARGARRWGDNCTEHRGECTAATKHRNRIARFGGIGCHRWPWFSQSTKLDSIGLYTGSGVQWTCHQPNRWIPHQSGKCSGQTFFSFSFFDQILIYFPLAHRQISSMYWRMTLVRCTWRLDTVHKFSHFNWARWRWHVNSTIPMALWPSQIFGNRKI